MRLLMLCTHYLDWDGKKANANAFARMLAIQTSLIIVLLLGWAK